MQRIKIDLVDPLAVKGSCAIHNEYQFPNCVICRAIPKAGIELVGNFINYAAGGVVFEDTDGTWVKGGVGGTGLP